MEDSTDDEDDHETGYFSGVHNKEETTGDPGSTESNQTTSTTSDQSHEHTHAAVIVSGDYINDHLGQMVTLQQSLPPDSSPESSDHGDENNPQGTLANELANESLEQKVKRLEEENKRLLVENKKVMEENKKLKENNASMCRHGGQADVQALQEEFSNLTANSYRNGVSRQEDVEANNVHPSSFQEYNESSTADLVETLDESIVPQEAFCICKHQLCAHLRPKFDQTKPENKHKMFINSFTSNMETCDCIVRSHEPRGDLNGDGVVIALLGPPCNTENFPSHSIISKEIVVRNTQDGASQSMLLKIAYERASGAKFCIVQTTFDDSSMLINPGATAAALNWLSNHWEQLMQIHEAHTLIVVIPYGGKYTLDEEKAVNEAAIHGIIIVAASGWMERGIAFPAKLQGVISVGAIQCEGTLAPFSSTGRELNCVAPGLIRYGDRYFFGTGISALLVGTDLALLFQHLKRTNGNLIQKGWIDTHVVQAFFEIIPARSKNVMAITGIEPLQVKSYVEHMKIRLNRREISTNPLKKDSISNTAFWSSRELNANYKKQKKNFPHLTGEGITIAIIDTVNQNFLEHMAQHSCEVHKTTSQVKFFSFKSRMLINRCCAKYIQEKGGHSLQCAAIIANTAPNCNILMIVHSDTDESVIEALCIVDDQEADVLLLSSVTTDHIDLDFLDSIHAHLNCRVVICAAGNEGKRDRNTICYPSRARGVIVVGACDCNGVMCDYSSCGRQVDFLCPGQFSVADSSGRGGTCYSASAAAAFIALILEYADVTLKAKSMSMSIWVSDEEDFKSKTLHSLMQNTHFMRALLSSTKLALCKRSTHVSTIGYGSLLIENLIVLEPESIHQEMTDFYTTNVGSD